MVVVGAGLKHFLKAVLFIVCAAACALSWAADSESVKIGVLTKGNEALTMQRWPATAEYLQNHIPGYSFEIIPLNFHQIDAAVKAQAIDFLVTNPASFVEMESHYGVSAVLTLNKRVGNVSTPEFAGVVLTQAGRRDLQDYSDLKGKSFIAVNETSFGGWAMAWHQMKLAGIDPFNDLESISFAGSHEAVVEAVLGGNVAAGTMRTGVLERMAKEGLFDLDQLHILSHEYMPHQHAVGQELPLLHSTLHYPEWPLASLTHTNKQLVKLVVQAMLEMTAEDRAAQLAGITGWMPAVNYLAVHNLMKNLRLAQYQYFGDVDLLDAIKQYWRWVVATVLILFALVIFSLYVVRLNSRVGQMNSELKQEIAKKFAAQSELLAKTDKVNKILDNVLEGVITIDTHGVIQTFNQAAEKIFGYQQAEVIGQNVKMLMPDKDAVGHDDYLDKYEATKKTKIIGYGREVFGLRKNGETFSLEIAVSEVVAHGQRMFIALLRDLTERKQAEKKIMHLVSAINCAAEGIFITDTDGFIEYMNPAYEAMTGYEQSALGKRKPVVFEMAERGESVCDDFFETVHGGLAWSGQYIGRRGGGSYSEEVTVAPVHEAGKVSCYVGVCRDVTDKLARDQQLKDLEKFEAVSKMAGGFAHDFNNLLSTIMGYTDITLLDAEPGSDLANDMESVMQAANRAKSLVQQLQAVSKQDYEEVLVFAPQKIVANVIELLNTMLPAGAVIHSDMPSDIGAICLSPEEFQQLLMSLAMNAIDALPVENGRVDISLEECVVGDNWNGSVNVPPNSYIVLCVADNGAGFDRLKKDEIFQPNFSSHDVVDGSLMGLAAVQGIVERHKGFIDVESTPGQGARFIIYLPLAQSGSSLHTNLTYDI